MSSERILMLFVGKVAGMNSSDGRINLLVTDKNKVQMKSISYR